MPVRSLQGHPSGLRLDFHLRFFLWFLLFFLRLGFGFFNRFLLCRECVLALFQKVLGDPAAQPDRYWEQDQKDTCGKKAQQFQYLDDRHAAPSLPV